MTWLQVVSPTSLLKRGCCWAPPGVASRCSWSLPRPLAAPALLQGCVFRAGHLTQVLEQRAAGDWRDPAQLWERSSLREGHARERPPASARLTTVITDKMQQYLVLGGSHAGLLAAEVQCEAKRSNFSNLHPHCLTSLSSSLAPPAQPRLPGWGNSLQNSRIWQKWQRPQPKTSRTGWG